MDRKDKLRNSEYSPLVVLQTQEEPGLVYSDF